MNHPLPSLIRKFLTSLCLVVACATHAQVIVVYSFGTTGSPTPNATTVASGLTASVFSGHLGTPTTGSSSPLYAAGSGGAYFTANTWTGSVPGVNYFEFTLTPEEDQLLSVTSLSFGYRVTSTGPSTFTVRSDLDGYASNLYTGVITGDSIWHSSGLLPIALADLDESTTFRIYGAGASSGAGTFRIDDVTLGGSVAAVPEPTTYALIFGAAALAGVVIRQRQSRR